MAPDLNSLPPSRRSSGPALVGNDQSSLASERDPRDALQSISRTSPASLAVTATINVGMQSIPTSSRRSSSSSSTALNSPRASGTTISPRLRERETRIDARRSARMAPLSLHDDQTLPQATEPHMQHGNHATISAAFRTSSPQSMSIPPNGTTRDPYHQRQPSLGEIHQELEQEQEAQVNRLLQMIRQQQQQIQQAQQVSGLLPSNPVSSAVDDSTPTSERSFSFPGNQLTATVTNPRPRSPTPQGQPRRSVDLSRQSSRRSRTSSRGTSSPSLLPLSGFHGEGSEHGWVLGGSRDESAFYQAETQMLTRENQMLRQRIRELERQVTELNVSAGSTSNPTPSTNLAGSPSASRDQVPSTIGSTVSVEDDGGKE